MEQALKLREVCCLCHPTSVTLGRPFTHYDLGEVTHWNTEVWTFRSWAPTSAVRWSSHRSSDMGIQEVNIWALVIVDRLKWLMCVGSCYSRNWNAWLQEVNKQFNLCAPGGLQAIMEIVSEPLSSREGLPMMQIKNCWSTDEGILGKLPPDWNSFQLTFFPNPLSTLYSPHREVNLRWDVKMAFEGT